jgi:anti-anti-sigma regulatory factor
MLSIEKRSTPEGLQVELSGAFEESVQLESLIGEVKGNLNVHCKGITRINSVGVKTWINYFQKLKMAGVRVRFFECSPSIVEQLNMISNFSGGGEVVSILLPYSCIKCVKEFVIPFETKKIDLDALPAAKCERSDCAIVFDDVPEEYFYFWNG